MVEAELLNYLEDFDYNSHYKERYDSFKKLIKNFNLQEYIDFKLATGKNHCNSCHFQLDERFYHKQAKLKIFNLFINTPNYLITTEIKPKNKINKNDLDYQFDCLIINVKNLNNFFKHLEERKFNKLDIQYLTSIEHNIIFAIELDGGSHSYRKDVIRDKFHFNNYNIPTIRYQVKHLVRMDVTPKEKKKILKHASIRNLLYHDFTKPELEDLNINDVILSSKLKHQRLYKHLV